MDYSYACNFVRATRCPLMYFLSIFFVIFILLLGHKTQCEIVKLLNAVLLIWRWRNHGWHNDKMLMRSLIFTTGHKLGKHFRHRFETAENVLACKYLKAFAKHLNNN